MLKFLSAGAFLFSFLSVSAFGQSESVNVSDLSTIEKYKYFAKKYSLEPELLYAVTLIESAVEREPGFSSPWPYVIRANDSRYYADSLEEAELALKLYIEKYGQHIDVGLGQTNLRWNGHRVKDAAELFKVEVSLDVTAQILKEAIRSSKDKDLGVGRYYSWSDKTSARRYGRKVLAAAKKIKSTQLFKNSNK